MQHTHFIVGIEIQRDLKASLINLYIEDLISETFDLLIADLKVLSKVVY
jgi:hypothetical protein